MINTINQKTKTIAINRFTILILISALFMSVALYIFLANSAVRNLTVLEKMESKKQALSIKVSEMESKRLAFENNINTQKATDLGFVEASNRTFIIKNSSKNSLSLNK